MGFEWKSLNFHENSTTLYTRLHPQGKGGPLGTIVQEGSRKRGIENSSDWARFPEMTDFWTPSVHPYLRNVPKTDPIEMADVWTPLVHMHLRNVPKTGPTELDSPKWLISEHL